MFVQWIDKKYSLGIPEIDRQHKQLFYITNKIHEASEDPEARKQIIAIFKQLFAYGKYHFASEEGMFQRYLYPQADSHKKRHKTFIEKVRYFLAEYRENSQKPLDEALDFLVKWIIEHISGEDRAYADYYRSKGIKPVVHYAVGSGSSQLNEEVSKLWEEQKLEMEIHSIDAQHKELVMILQQFNDLLHASESRRRVFTPTLIQKLYYYAQYHFTLEEQFMSKYCFPEISSHKRYHQDFILRIQDFTREYNLQKETLNDEIVFFLKDWVINHILKEDSKFKIFVKKEKIVIS